ncbi:MAG: hypothetical protein ABSG54_06460 [Terriglobia bacterium]
MPLRAAIKHAGPRPSLDASRAEKKHYSELVSKELALAVASELRGRGLKGVAPSLSSKKSQGVEKRIAGGLGDKQVDVTCATERAGLVLAISIKTISFPDSKTRNYQKHLHNRKADLAFEVTTLHKRFPYAVVGGLFFLYKDAGNDDVGQARISTFDRAHQLFKIFNRRAGHRNEEAKFEYLSVGLYGSEPPSYELFEAGNPQEMISLDSFLDELLVLVAERNPEQFVFQKGRLYKPSDLGIEGESELEGD